MFDLDFDITSRCVKCGRTRPAEGRRIVSSETDERDTFVVQTAEACDCGENRVKVTFALGDELGGEG